MSCVLVWNMALVSRVCGLTVPMLVVSWFIGPVPYTKAEFRAADCATHRVLTDEARTVLTRLHLPTAPPSQGIIAVRRAYVTEYDEDRRIPLWAAWFATKAFLDPPKRQETIAGKKRNTRWNTFHQDPGIVNPVDAADYTNTGFARGHIVPHYISGGDRDRDGKDAEVEIAPGLPVEDPDDACTVFEVNYMSNVTPQYQTGFNGSGGSWYKLETAIRLLIKRGFDFHIIAGPVFSAGPVTRIGPNSDITVPHSFFKIVVYKDVPIAFLFAHHPTDETAHCGCPHKSDPANCIVSVDQIEDATGLDFFGQLSIEEQVGLESRPNQSLWTKLLLK